MFIVNYRVNVRERYWTADDVFCLGCETEKILVFNGIKWCLKIMVIRITELN